MKKNILKFLILILVGFLSLGALGEVEAQVVEIENPLEAESFEDLIDSLINFIFWISIAIAPLMIIIAGFYWLTAAGDPDRVKTALNIIKWTVIGFAIILFAKGLVAIISHVLGGGGIEGGIETGGGGTIETK